MGVSQQGTSSNKTIVQVRCRLELRFFFFFFFGCFCSDVELGGGFKYFFGKVHPYLGELSNLTNIFQMG